MEKREPSCAGFGKVTWYQARGRTVWRFVKTLKATTRAGNPNLGPLGGEKLKFEKTHQPQVHCGSITRSQGVEVTKGPTADG